MGGYFRQGESAGIADVEYTSAAEVIKRGEASVGEFRCISG